MKILNVKETLDGQKKNKNAQEIRILLQTTLTEFDIWVNNLEELNIANQEYVTEMKKSDKEFIKQNMAKLQLILMDELDEFRRLVFEHEQIAAKQSDDLRNLVGLIASEMKRRDTQLNKISDHLQTGKISSDELNGILCDSKPIFSHQTQIMHKITNILKECVRVRNTKHDNELKSFLSKQ